MSASDALGEYLKASADEAVAFGEMNATERQVRVAKAMAEESRQRWVATKALLARLQAQREQVSA